jgi:hypothetical protein
LKAETDMHEELRSSPQPTWSRRFLRSRAGLQTAPCSSSHLVFLKHLGLLGLLVIQLAGSGQAGAQSNNTLVLEQHDTPAWLQEGPFIQARGNVVSLMFIVRRGHGFSYFRNLQERRGFAESSLEETWKVVFDDESIAHEKTAGSTYWTTQLFQAFGLDAESEYTQYMKDLVPKLQENGFRVGGYVGGTIAYETFLLENPAAEDWFVPLDYWGEAATYNKQYFRRRVWFQHPGYKDYIKNALRMGVKEFGMDMIHLDNISNHGRAPVFSHPMAIEAFRDYLRNKYTPERLKERLGFNDPKFVLPPIVPALGEQPFFYDPLVMQWIDFRCQTLGDYIKEMTEYARSLNKDVATDINIGTLSGQNRAWQKSLRLSQLLPHTDVYIVEGNNGGQYTDDGRLISNIRDYKIGRTYSNLVLNRMGSPGGIDYTPVTVPEQLAFNQHSMGPASMKPENWKYIEFLKEHFQHFLNTENIADVAILRSYPSMAYNNYSTHESTILFEQTLIQANIPFDIIFDEHLADLSKYSVLVLANQESLSDTALTQIKDFTNNGGGIVATGLTSLFDDWRRRRPTFGLIDLFTTEPPPPAARGELPLPLEEIEKRNRFGKGRVVYITSIEPSIIRSEFANMTNKYWKLPRNWQQLKEAVKWAAGGELSLELKAPPYVVAELLEQKELDELVLHLVNFNVVNEPEVENVEVDLLIPEGNSIKRVSLLTATESGTQTQNLRFKTNDNRIHFSVPKLNAYAMLLIE